MLAVFCVLAFWAGTRDVLPGDVWFTHQVQQIDWPWLTALTDATNATMGGVPMTIGGSVLAIVMFLWVRLDAAVLIATMAARLVNGAFKLIVESPRPDDDLVAVQSEVDGFGYPSGHTSSALLVIGALAWIIARRIENVMLRRLVWVFAGFWILATGIGRIRVGAHWPTDVLSAWLWTLPALVLITRMAVRYEHSRAIEGRQ